MVSATLKAEAAASARSAHAGRKRYWILPGLQMRMILWGVAVTALMATVAAWVVLLVVWPSFGSRFVWTSSGPNMDELFRDACMRVFLTTGLLVLIFGVIAFVTGLFVSHKIAGPVYRVRQVARRIAQGQPGQRVVLRRRDYMLDFGCWSTLRGGFSGSKPRSTRWRHTWANWNLLRDRAVHRMRTSRHA